MTFDINEPPDDVANALHALSRSITEDFAKEGIAKMPLGFWFSSTTVLDTDPRMVVRSVVHVTPFRKPV